MDRILIKNFGPIREVDIQIKPLTLFIGPQSSGKSTISKLIYLGQQWKFELLSFIINTEFKNSSRREIIADVAYRLETFLYDLVNFDFRTQECHIAYYKEGKEFFSFSITDSEIESERRNLPKVTFSVEFQNNLLELIEKSRKLQSWRKNNVTLSGSDEVIYRGRLEKLQNESLIALNFWFVNEADQVTYVPAGRSMFAILSDELNKLDQVRFDHVIRKFRNLITDLRVFYGKSQGWYLEKKGDNLENRVARLLGGEYSYDKGIGERILISPNRDIPINAASSGQQEALWIVLINYFFIQKRKPVFCILEEPEAHLFPKTQKELVELIALMRNQTSSSVLITTHSPYILEAINNLIFAYQVGDVKEDETDAIISKDIWIDKEHVAAYEIMNGTCDSIMDESLGQIRIDYIDSVSKEINSDYDRLFDLVE